MHNDLDNFKSIDKNILISKDVWLNDRLMTSQRNLLPLSLKFAKMLKLSFCPITQEHIQLLHDGWNHWVLSFSSKKGIQICDFS